MRWIALLVGCAMALLLAEASPPSPAVRASGDPEARCGGRGRVLHRVFHGRGECGHAVKGCGCG